MTYEEKLARFNAKIEDGGKVETEDWMPDDYRRGVLKFIEMHANSEIMGALPERERLPSAPSLRREMSLARRVRLIGSNYARRVATRQACCGHPGEPGC